MIKFKILFHTGYEGTDILNDNIDLHVVLETGEVYFGVAFTLANIQYLLAIDKRAYFWSTDMFIVTDLSEATLMSSIASMLDERILHIVLSKIGRIGENNLYMGISYDELINMGGRYSPD